MSREVAGDGGKSQRAAKAAARRSNNEKTPVFRLLEGTVEPFMRLLGRYELIGRENLPSSGAFVVAPNHFSNIDPMVVGLSVWWAGRAPRFLAKASLWKVPVLHWVLVKTGQVPVERGGIGSSDPLAVARGLVERGQGLIVYPEGTLTRDPDLWPMRGKSGVVRIALEGGIPVIPVAHWGAQHIMPPHTSKFRFRPFRRRVLVRIRFGAPVDLSAYAGKPLDVAVLKAATDDVMRAITGLLEELRNETAPIERWDPAKHGQAEFGRIDPK